MKLVDKKVSDFLAELAAKKAAPGGGSASAMSGAMAAALVMMVCEYTKNKDDRMIGINEQSKKLPLFDFFCHLDLYSDLCIFN